MLDLLYYNSCHTLIDGQCTTQVNVEQAGTDRFNTGTQVLSSNGFSCRGRVTGFMISMARGTGGGDNPSIEIWRPSGTTYNRRSQYTINNNDARNMGSYDLAEVTFTGVDVESGDVIGYYLSENLRRTVWNIAGSASYTISSNSALSSFDINGTNVQTVGDRQPLILAMFGEIIFDFVVYVTSVLEIS